MVSAATRRWRSVRRTLCKSATQILWQSESATTIENEKHLWTTQVSQGVISDGASEGLSISALPSKHNDAKTEPIITIDSFHRSADQCQRSSAGASQSNSAEANLSRYLNIFQLWDVYRTSQVPMMHFVLSFAGSKLVRFLDPLAIGRLSSQLVTTLCQKDHTWLSPMYVKDAIHKVVHCDCVTP